MRVEQSLKKQLTARLKRLRKRADVLIAEIAMVERLIADVEQNAQNRVGKLRKNSVTKWSVQGQVTEILDKVHYPLRAQYLFEKLRESDPELKSSTFRSYLKRMVDSGVLTRESRGRYEMRQKVPSGRSDPYHPRRRRTFAP